MKRLYCSVVTLLWLITACSSADDAQEIDDPQATDEAPVPLDQLPQQFASELCDTISPCCSVGRVPYDATSCKKKVSDIYQTFVKTSGGVKRRYDAVAARVCLSNMKSVLRTCSPLPIGADVSACGDIFDGTLPAGAECDGDVCANHAYCHFEPDQPGHCVERALAGAHGQAGDSCVGDCFARDDEMECTIFALPSDPAPNFCYAAENLRCVPAERGIGDRQAHPRHCVRMAQLGEPCSSLTSCVSGAFCQFGTCAKQDDTAACSGDYTPCTPHSYCDPSGHCSPRKPDGSPCSSRRECASDKCSAGGVCGSAATPERCAGDLYSPFGGV